MKPIPLSYRYATGSAVRRHATPENFGGCHHVPVQPCAGTLDKFGSCHHVRCLPISIATITSSSVTYNIYL